MAKIKLTDFKKFIGQMSDDERREELLILFTKIQQVHDYYAQELMSPDDRKKVLDDYKKKVYKEFWTRTDNPRVASNANVRKIITDFEKISVIPKEIVELLLYRVEIPLSQASEFGGGPEANFNAAMTAYEKALKIIVKEKLEDYFKDECLELSDNEDWEYWVLEQMAMLNETYLGVEMEDD